MLKNATPFFTFAKFFFEKTLSRNFICRNLSPCALFSGMASPRTEKIFDRKKKSNGTGKIFVAVLVVIVFAALCFAVAEKLDLTGTHFIFQGKADSELNISDETIDSDEQKPSSKKRGNADKNSSKKANKSAEKSDKDAKSGDESKQKKATKSSKKTTSSRSGKPTATPVPPLPATAFPEISVKQSTWPNFVRLTRSRTISVVDTQSGISMGSMEVPAGTVVRIMKVNADGTLDVFDRTGQKFRVSASGTNFAAAYAAAKNKPKTKKKPATKKVSDEKAVVAKKDAPASAPATSVPASSSASDTKKSSGFISAFGVVSDEDWDEAEAEE